MSGARLVVLGVIPARLESKRLPRKVLRLIAGRPMICHVWERARQSPLLGEVVVATDAPEVMDVCRGAGIPAVLTSREHPSGTDRVWEVAQSRAADVYVNIQGDYPLLTAGHVARLVEPFLTRPDTQVTTLRIRATPDEVSNPNAVKVVCDAAGRALYFSRSPIPYDRDGRRPAHYKHVGLYAYRRQALDAFHRLAPSPLELAESLEQLRLLENGIPILVAETDEPTIAVETEQELQAVEAHLASRRS
ncbi:MAG TPA: 3-deoxy-manno-octulosonate cytidylyltransferase [Methylomirabilota bacterium]|nr:3-deoxy-manno-octulosonate cytidylyltransferase [Methylomirabilota bacterium]